MTFDQINAALVSIQDLFSKHQKSNRPQTFKRKCKYISFISVINTTLFVFSSRVYQSVKDLVLPIALVCAEREGEICSDLLKVLQRNVTVHVQIIILYDRL